MTRYRHPALSIACLALALGSLAAQAGEDEASGPSLTPAQGGGLGLGFHTPASSGLRARSALIDFALPGPAFFGGARLGAWAHQAADLRDRLLPSWRLLGNEVRGRTSGLRATAGIVNVPRATAFGYSGFGEQAVVDTVAGNGGTRRGYTGASAATASAPYLGVGWHDTPAWGSSDAWAFNADIGVMALAPRSTVRFGRAPGGPLTLDDMTRDLRLTPLLQFGATYTF